MVVVPGITKFDECIGLTIREIGLDFFEPLGFFDVISSAMGDPLAAIDLFDDEINWF